MSATKKSENRQFGIPVPALLFAYCLLGVNPALLVADTQLYKRLCPSVGRLVGQSVRGHESKSEETRISAPAHPSATGGLVSGLVFFCLLLYFSLLSRADFFFLTPNSYLIGFSGETKKSYLFLR